MPSPEFPLSFIIPARNEFYHDLDLLSLTVENVLANTSQSNLIIILDGYDSGWPPKPLPVDPRVTVIHHSKSIGQRAACNEGVRASTAKFICKLDAHCAIDKDFDIKMMAVCDYETTLIPVQYNLHAFSWKCKKCGHESYQGPKPPQCAKCASRYLKIVPVWQPRGWKERDGVWSGNPRTTAWYFDTDLHFQYARDMQQRFTPDERGLTPTMTCLGACWMLHRERYWELDGMDEHAGSWGQQGVELCVKSWTSGGQVMTNHNTWFAHLFRTQPSFGFPYANPGADKARARSRALWLENAWPKQKYPLSWLIEKFKPVRDWHTIENHPVLVKVNEAGRKFLSQSATFLTGDIGDGLANLTVPATLVPSSERMPMNAVDFSGVSSGERIAAFDVVPVVSEQFDVGGVTAGLVVTDDVIQNGDSPSSAHRERFDQPGVHKAMNKLDSAVVFDMSVPEPITRADPDPAVFGTVANNSGEDNSQAPEALMADSEKLRAGHGLIIPRKISKCLLFYTCGSHDPLLEAAAKANLLRSKNGHELGCVALQRTDFGDWTVVLNREKSGTTMHYQIVAGLERSRADYVFLCESDVMYSASHFEFVPPRNDTIYYNVNVWRVRWSDGHAVRTANLQQVSGICANRELLLAHYRKRITFIESSGGTFDTKKMAYEPGTRGKFGDERIANWESAYPNLDITGHGNTLTTPHFSPESFRNKKFAAGWQETDGQIDGWPLIYGRVQEWLRELANGERP